MIGRLKGRLVGISREKCLLDVNGLVYEVGISKNIANKLEDMVNKNVELVVYHYISMDKHRGIPFLIGFLEELEKEFFELFISVSGIGPKAALKAFDKPIPVIAQAIEEGNIEFLRGLGGIGTQKAKQIVAALQGRVGRFALIRDYEKPLSDERKEIIEEAKQILLRLQYKSSEINRMIKKALESNPEIDNIEDLLNEIYRQRR